MKKKQVAAEHVLHTQTMFSQSVMVSVSVSKLGVTDLIFIDPGAKVNGAYYRDVLVSQQLLSMMLTCQASSSSFNGQRSCTPSTQHCATSQASNTCFIPPDLWSPNCPDLSPVDYKI